MVGSFFCRSPLLMISLGVAGLVFVRSAPDLFNKSNSAFLSLDEFSMIN